MFEFTSNPKGLEGVLAGLDRETLCRLDGEDITIPVTYPASAGLAYVAMDQQYGYGAAMYWAMQVSLGTQAWERLLGVGLTDEQLTQIAGVVVARIQGQESPIPQAAASDPKARKPRAPRSNAARK